MNHTPNYALNQWDPSDRIQRTDFNADNQKIDAALAGKGNCRIITGSYVGTGGAGQNNPTVITFPVKPLLLFIYTTSSPMIAIYGSEYGTQLGGPMRNNSLLRAIWEEKNLSFYDISSGPSASNQLNEAGKTYYYIVFAEA